MIHFHRCLYVPTTCAIQTQGQGAKKFGSLNDFEVHGVLEKELLSNG
jgi:hypothetical protein